MSVIKKKDAMCFDWFASVCIRQSCLFKHEIKLCTSVECPRSLKCKFLHLKEVELEILRASKAFATPEENGFSTSMTHEIRRIITAYLHTLPSEQKKNTFCFGSILGRSLCTCQCCEQKVAAFESPMCTKCKFNLIGENGQVCVTSCYHSFCKNCIDNSPVVEGEFIKCYTCCKKTKFQTVYFA